MPYLMVVGYLLLLKYITVSHIDLSFISHILKQQAWTRMVWRCRVNITLQRFCLKVKASYDEMTRVAFVLIDFLFGKNKKDKFSWEFWDHGSTQNGKKIIILVFNDCNVIKKR